MDLTQSYVNAFFSEVGGPTIAGSDATDNLSNLTGPIRYLPGWHVVYRDV